MEYDLAMKRQDVKSRLYKNVRTIKMGSYFYLLDLGILHI